MCFSLTQKKKVNNSNLSQVKKRSLYVCVSLVVTAKNLDVAERLQTHPSLLSRKSNRPKLEDLKKMDLSKMLTDETAEVKMLFFPLLCWEYFDKLSFDDRMWLKSE